MDMRQPNHHLSVELLLLCQLFTIMTTIIWILIIVAIVYYYKKKNQEQGAKNQEQEGQFEGTAKNQAKNKDEERAQTVETAKNQAKNQEQGAKNQDDAQDMPVTQSFPYPAKNPVKCRFPSASKIAEMKREEERQPTHNQVVWQDGVRKLWFDGDVLKLRYNGTDYTFSGHGYEPMAIILGHDGEAAYIHNSFIVEEECREFVKNPKYLCRTITGHHHNAKHFCMLLTTAIDYGYDWQINDLESKMFSLERFAQREMFYNADGIEFGIYGYEIQDDIDHSELDDDEPKTHFEYDVMYIIVDGKEYHLHDADMKRHCQLGIFEKGCHKPKIRINGTNGSVIAAYTDEWRSGKDFTPFGFPCNTKMFCQMMAYAIRTGKLEYQMQKLANIVAGEPTESQADDTIYEDKNARLYLEGTIACLKYKGRTYHFGYDGREPFATISGSNIYVIIRQGENVDATCRYFQNHPEGTIETITGRKLDVAHFCKLLCAAVAHDHGQDSDMEYYMDALERKAFELEDYQERRRKK